MNAGPFATNNDRVLKTKPRKTVEDYLRLPEGTRAELIEGEILTSPSLRERHQAVVGNLFALLRAFIRECRLGRIYTAPFDVHLPSGDVVEPDLIFVATEHASILKDWIRGVPDLLVEVVSPDSAERDRIVKRHIYERNGVREYWLVEPAEHAVEVLEFSAARFVSRGYFEEADRVTSGVLAGLSLPVRAIFEQD